jgi:hypothetical protein
MNQAILYTSGAAANSVACAAKTARQTLPEPLGKAEKLLAGAM